MECVGMLGEDNGGGATRNDGAARCESVHLLGSRQNSASSLTPDWADGGGVAPSGISGWFARRTMRLLPERC